MSGEASFGESDSSTERCRAAMRRMASLVSSSVDQSSSDNERVRRLLTEAASGVTTTLSKLEGLMERQRADTEATLSLLKDTSGLSEAALDTSGDTEGLLQFLSRARGIMSELTRVVTEFSRENVRVAYAVEDLVQELENVFEDVDRVDGIADDTALLAINAALEAARAGEAGRGFGVVSSEVRKLSHSTKQLNVRITENVERASELVEAVKRAIDSMAAQDFGVDGLVAFDGEVSQFLERICELHGSVGEIVTELEAASRSVDEVVSEAIRQLQFEDIANQVSRAADTRMRNMASALQEAVEASAATSPEALMEAVVDAFAAVLETNEVHMPADQATLDEGEAFLF